MHNMQACRNKYREPTRHEQQGGQKQFSYRAKKQMVSLRGSGGSVAVLQRSVMGFNVHKNVQSGKPIFRPLHSLVEIGFI